MEEKKNEKKEDCGCVDDRIRQIIKEEVEKFRREQTKESEQEET